MRLSHKIRSKWLLKYNLGFILASMDYLPRAFFLIQVTSRKLISTSEFTLTLGIISGWDLHVLILMHVSEGLHISSCIHINELCMCVSSVLWCSVCCSTTNTAIYLSAPRITLLLNCTPYWSCDDRSLMRFTTWHSLQTPSLSSSLTRDYLRKKPINFNLPFMYHFNYFYT